MVKRILMQNTLYNKAPIQCGSASFTLYLIIEKYHSESRGHPNPRSAVFSSNWIQINSVWPSSVLQMNYRVNLQSCVHCGAGVYQHATHRRLFLFCFYHLTFRWWKELWLCLRMLTCFYTACAGWSTIGRRKTAATAWMVMNRMSFVTRVLDICYHVVHETVITAH